MVPRAPFGSTGHESRRTLFGAAALGRVSEAEADRALELVLRYDLDHIDTAASYGDSELHIARWLAREGRDRFFLATKTGKRTHAEARDVVRAAHRSRRYRCRGALRTCASGSFPEHAERH